MKRSLLSPGLLLAVTAALAVLAPACSRNAQGERCSTLNDDEDCEPGLVCTDGGQLGQKSAVCCPDDLATATDPRCSPNTGAGGEGGTGATTTGTAGTGGTGGAGGTGGGSAGGAGGTGGAGGMSTGGTGGM